jgi:predicted Ser/Thr protein kinase
MLLMSTNSTSHQELIFPGGPLPLNSPLYIHRPSIEDPANREVLKPGSMLRIQAPRQMGKSSLLMHLMAYAKSQDYRRVKIDFQEADQAVFSCIDTFLRWFCANVGRQLRLENRLDHYWDQDIGSKVSCTYYFEDYLLETANAPVFLSLNEVDRVFEYPDIAQDFFPLLRYWHEQAKHVEIFRNLRLAIIYSTELYVPLQIHQSPFNVGLPIYLPEFDLVQTQELAVRYGLSWAQGDRGIEQLRSLMNAVGGSPYRLSLAFYALRADETLSLERILQLAFASEGIYGNHLQMLALRLHKDAHLKAAYKEVVSAKDWVEIEPMQAYKIVSLGLGTIKGSAVKPSCELYRRYFHTHLSDVQNSESRIRALEVENQRLKDLTLSDTPGFAAMMQLAKLDQQSKESSGKLPLLGSSVSPAFPQVDAALGNPPLTELLLLGGRYQIRSKLGSGGFGQTYLAEDTQRPNLPTCIVKKLATWFGAEELAIARRLFATEAQTLEQLGTHGQIPRLLAYFEQNAEFYLVQEFIEGQPLSTEIADCVMGWSEEQIIDFLNEILPILAFVHGHQVIHRDLKPDNILRRQSDGKLVLIDFGVAKTLTPSIDGSEQRTVAVGTCGYASWEQSQGVPQINSDLYAIGMIAIEGATGIHPDRIGRDSRMGLKWRTGLVGFNPWLAAILDGMVHLNHIDRYQTAEEVLKDLSMIVRHE